MSLFWMKRAFGMFAFVFFSNENSNRVLEFASTSMVSGSRLMLLRIEIMNSRYFLRLLMGKEMPVLSGNFEFFLKGNLLKSAFLLEGS